MCYLEISNKINAWLSLMFCYRHILIVIESFLARHSQWKILNVLRSAGLIIVDRYSKYVINCRRHSFYTVKAEIISRLVENID